MRKTIISFTLSAVFFCIIGYPNTMEARDLTAGVCRMPPHAFVGKNGQPEGGFVDLIKAIDSVYTKGKISIKVLPIKRSQSDLINGYIDFQFPVICNPLISGENLPFICASESVADVAFVLYTRADMKILPLDDLGKYEIETMRGSDLLFPFKILGIDSVKQGILKVLYGRSDGLIAEQDASDLFIRQNKIKNIRRTLYATWTSTIAIHKGPESQEIDRIISNSLRRLKKNEELQKIADTIHRPFENWQPYLIDWPDTN
ncbi:hypothetical protein DSCO28_17420 [Desulfosarcina ovata subsp. sediminis]|uniref:Uncharacterized protein n=1 Tax=Desulfosarcina ovata subsp. sediminis TaxID=885957 RepID=A0A5K7ZJJ7_9BACT|nr:transporter substrate-binding domain-containing protein [Desulfosarcina ovata]BBO81176.1 hypothetical protein DSCO28_17420 [Desulfosarcina ovata subsp. sediminis]